MQVRIDVKCMYNNFGGCGLSGFEDTATFKKKKKPEQNRAACMHSCMLRKTILSSLSALLSGLDHFYNGFEVSFDL